MDNTVPIQIKVERDLIENDGIESQHISFSSLSLESDKLLGIRKTKGAKNELQVLDLEGGSRNLKKPVTAESAIVHPTKLIVALRRDTQMQVYDLENKVSIKVHIMDEPVEYWKWVSTSVIGIVTSSNVYHWDIYVEGDPSPYFSRYQELSKHKIIEYSTSPDINWAFISSLGVNNERNIIGALQLYYNEKKLSQIIKAQSATFANVIIDPIEPKLNLLVLCNRELNDGVIRIVGLPDAISSDKKYGKRSAEIPLSASKKDNFPLFVKYLSKYSMVLVVTKYTSVYAYDLATCTLICSFNNFCTFPCLSLVNTSDERGLLAITKSGKIYSIKIDEHNLITWILNSTASGQLIATNIAISANLPGAESIIVDRFNNYIESSEYDKAAKLAAKAPNSILRTQETLLKLKSLADKQPQLPPLLTYFKILLQDGKLYHNESMELVIPVINSKKMHMLAKWIESDKLTLSEEIADFIMQQDKEMALEVYKKVNCHKKVVGCLVAASKFDEVTSYCQEKKYDPDYFSILASTAESNTEIAHSISKYILEQDSPPATYNIEKIASILLSVNDSEHVQKSISFLLSYVQENKEDYSKIQTELIKKSIELNKFAAEAILSSKMLKVFDKEEIAKICESKAMYKNAFLLHQNLADMSRCLKSVSNIDDPEISTKLASLPRNSFFECLYTVAQSNNPRKDIVIAKILMANKGIDPSSALSFLSQHNLQNSTLLYLDSLSSLNLLDAEMAYTYVEIACKLSRYQEAAEMCKTCPKIDYVKIKDFLKYCGGMCCIPLIQICNRFDLVEELIVYLYQKNEIHMIKDYVENVNPSKTPEVIDYLIKLDCSDDLLRTLINLGGRKYSLDKIVKVCESGDRLSVIQDYIYNEAKIRADSVEVNTVLAKIIIEKNVDAEKFLRENNYYDFKVIGDYCRSTNPNLALIAYKRGNLTDEIISLTNESMMFKDQVEYLMELSNQKVWEKVVSENNQYRESIVSQLTNVYLLENYSRNNVSTLVKAYMSVGNDRELLKILELLVKIPRFKESRNLRNLFVLTAIKCERSLLKTCLDDIDDFDAIEIANTVKQKGYYEEAYQIYVKSGFYKEAIGVAIQNLKNMDLAIELAVKVNSKDVWNKIIKGRLDSGNIDAAIQTCIDSNDYSLYPEILSKAKTDGNTHKILDFIRHARMNNREQMLDTEYCMILATSNNISELESLISSPNLVNHKYVAEECYANGLYKAASMLFAQVPDYVRLSQTLLHLNDLNGAFDAANKAKNAYLFLQIAIQCVNNGNFSLADKAGQNLLSKPEKFENLIICYETCGRFKELCSLLEYGVSLESNANMNICTDLAILYCKYDSAKLIPYITKFINKLNVPKLVKACSTVKLWKEIISLYVLTNEHDKAISVIINDASVHWNHTEFKALLTYVKNYDLLEQVIKYYVEQHVEFLDDILFKISGKLNYPRLVSLFKNMNCIHLIVPFLEKNISINDSSVNSVICGVLIEKRDSIALRNLLDSYSNIDLLEVAKKLENHDDFELRRLSSYLYAKNGRISESVTLSINSGVYYDAIITVYNSRNKSAAEMVLRTLAKGKLKHWFTFMIYKCHNVIDPSLVMELSWLNGLTECCMPYYIQTIQNLNMRIEFLESKLSDKSTLPSNTTRVPMYLP